jgi:hypothetical protein
MGKIKHLAVIKYRCKYRKSKKKAIKDSCDTVAQSITHMWTVSCNEKNAIIEPIIVYLNNPFQDSTNA